MVQRRYGNSTVASFDLHNDVNGGEIHNLDENRYLYIRVPISSLTANCQNSLKQGTKVLDSTTLKIEVKSTFFGKLISFFTNFPFNLFKWKKITVYF